MNMGDKGKNLFCGALNTTCYICGIIGKALPRKYEKEHRFFVDFFGFRFFVL